MLCAPPLSPFHVFVSLPRSLCRNPTPTPTPSHTNPTTPTERARGEVDAQVARLHQDGATLWGLALSVCVLSRSLFIKSPHTPHDAARPRSHSLAPARSHFPANQHKQFQIRKQSKTAVPADADHDLDRHRHLCRRAVVARHGHPHRHPAHQRDARLVRACVCVGVCVGGESLCCLVLRRSISSVTRG